MWYKGEEDESWTLRAEQTTASDIQIGYDGSVWILGTQINANGEYPILYYDTPTHTFVPVEGTARKLAVDPYGKPWIIN